VGAATFVLLLGCASSGSSARPEAAASGQSAPTNTGSAAPGRDDAPQKAAVQVKLSTVDVCRTSAAECAHAGTVETHLNPSDEKRAVVQWSTLCEAGDASACGSLAYLLLHGQVVEHDPVRALALSDKSCTAGYGLACA
jgi:TPR repeat protein